ncbi:hypothetical protein FXO37_13868 [Capsicum annuum]|nr:hypothetical protein FXO37_13868 [Capsicum annuum]
MTKVTFRRNTSKKAVTGSYNSETVYTGKSSAPLKFNDRNPSPKLTMVASISHIKDIDMTIEEDFLDGNNHPLQVSSLTKESHKLEKFSLSHSNQVYLVPSSNNSDEHGVKSTLILQSSHSPHSLHCCTSPNRPSTNLLVGNGVTGEDGTSLGRLGDRRIKIITKNPPYLAQVIMKWMSQGLKNFGHNMWMTCPYEADSPVLRNSPKTLNAEMNLVSQSFPFFPPRITTLLEEGPPFVLTYRYPLPHNVPPLPTLNPFPNIEALERKKTIKDLKKNNMELERILASLKVQRIEVITLGKTLHLTFEDLVSEIVTVLIPPDLIMLDLKIVPPSAAIGKFYKTKMSPLSRSKKRGGIISNQPFLEGQGNHVG